MVEETRWKSIYVVTIICLLDAIRMSTMGTSSWPYLSIADSNATETFFGYSKSIGSIGNIAAVSLSGYISNKLSNTSPMLIVGKIFSILGCIFYISINLFPVAPKYIFLSAELFFGISTGAVAIWRAHVAMTSTEKDRGKAYSMAGLAITSGMVIGPILMLPIGFFLSPSGIKLLFSLNLSIYTVPGYITLIGTIAAIVLLVLYFDGRITEKKKTSCSNQLDTDGKFVVAIEKKLSISLSSNSIKLLKSSEPTIDYFVVTVCFLMKLSFITSIIYLIALSSPYTMTVFKWTALDAVIYQAFTMGSIGFLGIICNLGYLFGILSRLCERKWILLGLCLQLLFYLATYPWPFLQGSIGYETYQNINLENGTILKQIYINGCDPNFDWCISTPPINIYVYHVFLIICMGIALPLSHLNLDILYSKILGPIKQGTMQAIFIGIGDFANMVGPALISKIYTSFGPKPIWIFNMSAMALCIVVWLMCYSRMVPFAERKTNVELKTSI